MINFVLGPLCPPALQFACLFATVHRGCTLHFCRGKDFLVSIYSVQCTALYIEEGDITLLLLDFQCR
jgi:hypothetical protein